MLRRTESSSARPWSASASRRLPLALLRAWATPIVSRYVARLGGEPLSAVAAGTVEGCSTDSVPAGANVQLAPWVLIQRDRHFPHAQTHAILLSGAKAHREACRSRCQGFCSRCSAAAALPLAQRPACSCRQAHHSQMCHGLIQAPQHVMVSS